MVGLTAQDVNCRRGDGKEEARLARIQLLQNELAKPTGARFRPGEFQRRPVWEPNFYRFQPRAFSQCLHASPDQLRIAIITKFARHEFVVASFRDPPGSLSPTCAGRARGPGQ